MLSTFCALPHNLYLEYGVSDVVDCYFDGSDAILDVYSCAAVINTFAIFCLVQLFPITIRIS